jgi:hypothetical protein
VQSATTVAESAEKATGWLKKGAKILGAIATAVQFLGPVLDIVLLFAPASKSEELKAIESGFAKMGAKIDAVSDQIKNVKDSLMWNGVVAKLSAIEATAKQTTNKYKGLVSAIDGIGPDITDLPLDVKNRIEDLVNAVRDTGNIGNSLQLVENLYFGKSALTDHKGLLELFQTAVENDCTKLLPLASELTAMVKQLQRVQYFYEINQKLITTDNDKGYPKVIYDMYKGAVTQYTKCTRSADTEAQKVCLLQLFYN